VAIEQKHRVRNPRPYTVSLRKMRYGDERVHPRVHPRVHQTDTMPRAHRMCIRLGSGAARLRFITQCV